MGATTLLSRLASVLCCSAGRLLDANAAEYKQICITLSLDRNYSSSQRRSLVVIDEYMTFLSHLFVTFPVVLHFLFHLEPFITPRIFRTRLSETNLTVMKAAILTAAHLTLIPTYPTSPSTPRSYPSLLHLDPAPSHTTHTPLHICGRLRHPLPHRLRQQQGHQARHQRRHSEHH